MTIASLYCAFRFSPAVRQIQAVTSLRAAGVPISYVHGRASWLQWMFGADIFGTIQSLTLRSDDEVSAITAIPDVRHIYAVGPSITDASLNTLAKMPNLTEITLDNTSISLDAMKSFKDAHPDCRIKVYLQ
jgi:hypothetical protein